MFDTSLIVQMVQHDCLNTNHFLNVTSFVIKHIQATQAPAHTTATQEWYDKWRSRFLSGELTFARLCAQFLARAHEDIDHTQEVCQRIRASNSRLVSKWFHNAQFHLRPLICKDGVLNETALQCS